MTNEEKGVYITALCIQWNKGGVTEDEMERLSRAMALPSITHVKAKFKQCSDGLFRNQRLELERRKQKEYRENRRKSGELGAKRRWHSHSTAIAQPMASGMAKDGSPSPSTNSKTKQVEVFPEALRTTEFKEAWNRWNEHLKQKKKTPTSHAQDLQLSKLEKMGVNQAIITLNHCIEHNWQGIYEPIGNSAPPPPKQQSIFDQDWRESL